MEKQIASIVLSSFLFTTALASPGKTQYSTNIISYSEKGDISKLPTTHSPYDEIYAYGEYRDNWAMVQMNGLYGFINLKGEEVVAPKYKRINHFGEYLDSWALVETVNGVGFIHHKGQEIVPTIYTWFSHDVDGVNLFIKAKLGNAIGFINSKGEFIPEK